MTPSVCIGSYQPYAPDTLILSHGSPLVTRIWASPADGPIAITLAGLPGNVSASLSSTTITRFGGCVELTLTASSAVSGQFTFTANASVGGAVVASASAQVTGSTATTWPTVLASLPAVVPYTLAFGGWGSDHPQPGRGIEVIATTSNGIPTPDPITITLADPDPSNDQLTLGVVDTLTIPAGQGVGRARFVPARAGMHSIIPTSSTYPASTIAIDPPPLVIEVFPVNT